MYIRDAHTYKFILHTYMYIHDSTRMQLWHSVSRPMLASISIQVQNGGEQIQINFFTKFSYFYYFPLYTNRYIIQLLTDTLKNIVYQKSWKCEALDGNIASKS